jgi:formate hydrogenlyase subunit 6/NADH:ubiquinone oxidoreductase subunit I
VLREAGHEVTLHDIVRHRDPPPLDNADLLCVAAPTMYFRATFAMERFVSRLPALPRGTRRPAFQIATCGGEPGAHFTVLAEMLEPKGWITLGAHHLISPPNWPLHLALLGPWSHATTPIARQVAHALPFLRPFLAFAWPNAAEPDRRDRGRLESFVLDVARRAEEGRIDDAPPPSRFRGFLPGTVTAGRLTSAETMGGSLRLRVDPARCEGCGACTRACPVEAIVQEAPDRPPVLRAGCTGCWGCFNHCPHGALSAFGAPNGKGRYDGPTAAMRTLFADEPDPDDR